MLIHGVGIYACSIFIWLAKLLIRRWLPLLFRLLLRDAKAVAAVLLPLPLLLLLLLLLWYLRLRRWLQKKWRGFHTVAHDRLLPVLPFALFPANAHAAARNWRLLITPPPAL
eukprot:COSAG05_NODE_2744_length_2701_cov_2.618755_2_plen_112_part_00